MTKPKRTKASASEKVETKLFNIPTGIDLKPFKTIRIAVSGDVILNKLEVDIINTLAFQRLRRIKELGTTYLVYPTALHTRFDHSLGTLSMAMEMVRAIRENKHNNDSESKIDDEQEQLIRLLALLHDIGHIPFGHTLEDECRIFPRHDEDTDRTEYFLGNDNPIGEIIIKSIGLDMYVRFMKIFNATKKTFKQLGKDLFIYDLVNNTVCADLLDYLRRDCYFCNVILDTDYRFLKYLYLCNDSINGVAVRRVVVRLWKTRTPSPRRDILSGLIRLLDNRYLLGERVYFHHAKLISGAMLAGAVQRAKAEGKLKKEDMYEFGDEALLTKLEEFKIKPVSKLVKCLQHRKLWKQIYDKNWKIIEAEQHQARDVNVEEQIETLWMDSTERTKQEDNTSENLGMSPGDFLIYCPDRKMAMKLAEMKVFWNGHLKPLSECKDDPIIGPKLEVILQSHQNLWAIRAFLNPDSLDKRDKVESACERLFNFDPRNYEKYEKRYYGIIVDEIAESNNWQRGLRHDDYEKKKAKAVKTLVSVTDSKRDRKAILEIVNNAFTE